MHIMLPRSYERVSSILSSSSSKAPDYQRSLYVSAFEMLKDDLSKEASPLLERVVRWIRNDREMLIVPFMELLEAHGVLINKDTLLEGELDLDGKLKNLSEKVRQEILHNVNSLKFLRSLIISNNALKTLPQFKLPNLKNLNAVMNELTEVQVGGFPKLEILYLACNYLREVDISNLPSLVELHLGSNHLIKAPSLDVPSLKVLRLDNNQFEEIEIANFRQLIFLDLSLNSLVALKLQQLPSLRILILHNNIFSTVAISDLPSLRHLDLEENELTEVVFSGIKSLKLLNLNCNNLVSLPSTVEEFESFECLLCFQNPLLQTATNESERGVEELKDFFGECFSYTNVPAGRMSPNTNLSDVKEELSKAPLRINLDEFSRLTTPGIPESTLRCEDMISLFEKLIDSMNKDDEARSDYLSFSSLINEKMGVGLSNNERINRFLLPRIRGYVRRLYECKLGELDVLPKNMMYKENRASAANTLSFIVLKIVSENDKDLQILRFTQLINGMIGCHTGQTEAYTLLAYSILGVQVKGGISLAIKQYIALKKNIWFANAILRMSADMRHNVHITAKYREMLTVELGLQETVKEYSDGLGLQGGDPFSGNAANVYQVYFELVTPMRIVQWIRDYLESVLVKQYHKNHMRILELEDRNKTPSDVSILQNRLEVEEDPERRKALTLAIEMQSKVKVGLTVSEISELAALKENAQEAPPTTLFTSGDLISLLGKEVEGLFSQRREIITDEGIIQALITLDILNCDSSLENSF